MSTMPTVSRVYKSYALNSTHWDSFSPRDGDAAVVTPYKSGTTWMIAIIGHLIFDDLQPRRLNDFSRWIDACWAPLEEDIAALEAMPHRRVLKSHLALDGLPFHPQLRYIYVGRDLRDIFMSLWNHHTHYAPETIERMRQAAERIGQPMPPMQAQDIRGFWQQWITRGYFEWEREGYPYWSTLHHLRTWWAWRHLPNLLFVHFNDLLTDLPGEIARVARFLGIAISVERCAQIAELVTFSAMKRDAELIIPGFTFRGGPRTFIHKGTNGRWRDVLTAGDLQLYDEAVARELPPDAARWLETGGAGSTVLDQRELA